VSWPVSKTTQSFRDIAADQAIAITEGADNYKVLKQPPLPPPATAVAPPTTSESRLR
jgi:hypothetical protein